jgi:hypothetical protein
MIKIIRKYQNTFPFKIPKDGIGWKKYLRIRVILDATKQLGRGKKVRIGSTQAVWATFWYERLPNLCYYILCLDHEDRECRESYQYLQMRREDLR